MLKLLKLILNGFSVKKLLIKKKIMVTIASYLIVKHEGTVTNTTSNLKLQCRNLKFMLARILSRYAKKKKKKVNQTCKIKTWFL